MEDEIYTWPCGCTQVGCEIVNPCEECADPNTQGLGPEENERAEEIPIKIREFKIQECDRHEAQIGNYPGAALAAAERNFPDIVGLQEVSFCRYRDDQGRVWSLGCFGPTKDLTWTLEEVVR